VKSDNPTQLQKIVSRNTLFLVAQRNLVQEKDFLQAAVGGQMKSIKEYGLIILFTIIGASLLVSCNNLISMYLSIELQSFAVYILASLYRDNENAVGAGLKYFLLGALSSAFILLGSSFIYFSSGLLNFSELYIFLSTSLQEISGLGLEIVTFQKDVTCILGIFLIIIGLLFKVSAAPFHY
jgi:NADH-ubiquinone oxidoreductase chain 2